MNKFLIPPKAVPPENSWWTDPTIQSDREAFQRRLVDEELRMLGGKFGRGPTHDKFTGNR